MQQWIDLPKTMDQPVARRGKAYTRTTDDIASDPRDGESVDPQLPTGDHPRDYRPDDGLVSAVNVALTLERPLLLTGEPGTGKTQLAHSVAWQLASRRLFNVTSPLVDRFETKSTSIARDLFYQFDMVGRFQASHTAGSANNLDYITYSALGRAVIESQPRDAVKAYLPASYQYSGPRRCVALIDEIDKAPRDFPNDLLTEIDHLSFRVSELRNVQIGGAGRLRPIVIITSNSERALPDPFLRRCIYYNIPAPDEKRLEEILLARLPSLAGDCRPLLGPAVKFYLQLREQNLTRRRTSVAELLQWLTYLMAAAPWEGDAAVATAGASLKDLRARALEGVSALAKDLADQPSVTTALGAFIDGL